MMIAVVVIIGVCVPLLCYFKRGCLWYNVRKDAAARAYLRAKLRSLTADAPPVAEEDGIQRRPSIFTRMHVDLTKSKIGRMSSGSLDTFDEEGSLTETPGPAARGDFSPARVRG